MNNIVIMGRVAADIELKTSGSGVEYCNFSVAVDRKPKKDEEKKADFFKILAFGKTAAFVQKYFHKGDGILVQGRMESDKYTDKDGNNRTAWSLLSERIEFPLAKKSGSDYSGSNDFGSDSGGSQLPF